MVPERYYPMLKIRDKNFWSMLLYCIGWMAPSLGLVLVNLDAASAAKLALSAALALIWHLAFRNFLQAVYFSLFFFLLIPFDLFFFFIYHEPLTTPVLLSVGNTNWNETLDFMHGRFPLLLSTLVVLLGVWFQILRIARRGFGADWRIFNPAARYASRSVIAILITSLCVYTFTPATEYDFLASGKTGRNVSPVTALNNRIAPVFDKLKGLFPLGRFISIGEYYREETRFDSAIKWKSMFRFNAKQIDAPQKRQVYVLVIGESARGDHSALNGYGRDTSPLLARQQHVTQFTDIVSPWSVTRMSVPTIVTGHQSSAHGSQLKSIVSAFREAGFKTYWLSNQQHEDAIDYFAREADERIFLNISALVMERNGNYDGNVVAPLEKLIDRNEPRQFIVMHLLGSHDAYQKRYPETFDFFRPSLSSEPDLDYHDARNKTKVINAYDNSMRYTDHVLTNIIATVDKSRAVAALIYSSDHGETLFDGACQRSGHGSSARQEYVVNAFSWVSDQHKVEWPEKFQLMKEHSNAPLTTEFLFETMLGLANIEIDKSSPHLNLAGAGFQPKERWVNARQIVNWDKARTEGPCNQLTGGARN